MSWKDFFFFSKSQQVGIIILIVLILLVTASIWLMPLIIKPPIEKTDTTYLAEAKEFKESLMEIERSKPKWNDRYKDYKKYEKRSYPTNYNDKYADQDYTLFDFDPNTADSSTFIKVGLRPYVARNIIKYRNKGGYFKDADDFSKIYGIESDKFAELKPYIKIRTKQSSENDENLEYSDDTDKNLPTKRVEIIEINTADTTQFMQLPGLGSYTAYAIIRYRKALGGFHSIEQMKEIDKLRTENYEKFAPYCIVDKERIEKININTASIERLKRHPYIGSFQRAKAIYEYRRYKIKLHKIEELKAVKELSEEDLARLKPYLNFE